MSAMGGKLPLAIVPVWPPGTIDNPGECKGCNNNGCYVRPNRVVAVTCAFASEGQGFVSQPEEQNGRNDSSRNEAAPVAFGALTVCHSAIMLA